MRCKRLAGRVFLILTGVALPLLLAEAVARLGADVPVRPENPDLLWESWRDDPEALINYYNEQMAYDPVLGMIVKAQADYEKWFLDRPGYRVILLGDSITGDAPYEQAMTQSLRRAHPGITFNILNAGVAGWDTRQELEYLRRRVSRLKPRLVIAQFCINDFDLTPVVWRTSDGRIAAYNAGPWVKYLRPWMLTQSVLARKVFYALLKAHPQGKGMDREKVRLGFKGLDELSRREGFALRIVLMPSFGAPPEYDAKEREAVQTIVKELRLGETVVDLTDLPLRRDTGPWKKSANDVTHPNHAGAAFMSEIIVRALPPLTL